MFLGTTVIWSSYLITFLLNVEAMPGSRGAGGGEA